MKSTRAFFHVEESECSVTGYFLSHLHLWIPSPFLNAWELAHTQTCILRKSYRAYNQKSLKSRGKNGFGVPHEGCSLHPDIGFASGHLFLIICLKRSWCPLLTYLLGS